MTSSERIPQVLDAVRRLWEKTPEQRLGQLITNLSHWKLGTACPFYIEDDDIIEAAAKPQPIFEEAIDKAIA